MPEDSQPDLILVGLHAGYHHTSLAARSLAAFCASERFAGRIQVREWLVKAGAEPVIVALRELAPRLVGFSVYIWNVEQCLQIARALKTSHPQTLILFGGPEAGPRAAELLETEASIDYVIDGEGEAAFRDLCLWLFEATGAPESIAGLVRRTAFGIQHNPQQMVDTTELPGLQDMDIAIDRDLIYWETSRGCPFRCSFCTSCSDALRQFPMERIDRDLAFLSGLQGKTIKLLDRSFHLGRKRTTELLGKFMATPADLRFHLELNPDRISDEAMALFRQAPAGKFQFEVGLQTLNEEVLKAIDRDMDVDKSLAKLQALIAIGKHPVHVDLIAGLPGEDAASFDRSLDRCFALYPDHLQLGILKLLPGTPMLADAAARGYRWDTRPPYTVASSDCMNAATLQRYEQFAELLERLWNSGWMRFTLPAWVESHHAGSLSRAFDHLLAEDAAALLQRAAAPKVFDAFCRIAQPALQADPVLRECLLWDYALLERPSSTTPDWIRQQWQVERGRPVLALSAASADVISRRKPTAVEAGRYRVRLEHHLKGRPVHFDRLD